MIDPRKIAFDIDGVVADTMNLFLDIARDDYGVAGIGYQDITRYALEECLDMDNDLIWTILIRIMEGDYSQTLKPMPGAAAVLTGLCEHASPLLFVTARHRVGPVADWLKKLLPVDPSAISIVATGSFKDKAAILLKNGIHFFLEDRLETCHSLKLAGIEPIVYKQPWNREPHPFEEVDNWNELQLRYFPQLAVN